MNELAQQSVDVESEVVGREVLKAMDIDSLLDLSRDQVSDIQPFQLVPTGQYKFQVKSSDVEEVGNDGKRGIVVVLQLTECVELENEADAESLPDFPHDFRSVHLPGYGTEAFVTMFRDFAQENGLDTLREMVEGIPGATGELLIQHTNYKDKDTKETKETNRIDVNTVSFA